MPTPPHQDRYKIFGNRDKDYVLLNTHGNIVQAQKTFTNYKLRSTYDADGYLIQVDSIVGGKEYCFAFSDSGKVVTTSFPPDEPQADSCFIGAVGNHAYVTDGTHIFIDLNKAASLVETVVAELQQSAKNRLRAQMSAKQRSAGARPPQEFSPEFISKANTCIGCINRLRSCRNADGVYNTCLIYFRTFKRMRAMRKSKAELELFNNISTSFNRTVQAVSKELNCSGAVMRAQLNGMK